MSVTHIWENGELVEVATSSPDSSFTTNSDELMRLSQLTKHQLAEMYLRGEIDEVTFARWVNGAD